MYKAALNRNIELTEAFGEAFENRNRSLLDRPVVQIYDPQQDFVLETDASTVAAGAVLKQQLADTQLEHPLGFFSRELSGSEPNYSVY